MKQNRTQVALKMLAALTSAILVLGLLLFLSAGSPGYINGWIFIGTLTVLMLSFGLYLLAKSPEVLENRMKSREKEKTQQRVVKLSGLMFVASFLLSGFNYRFGWPGTGIIISMAALAVMVAGYFMFMAVILQNAYASRVVAVQENQKIISTGLYGAVRHPMYSATLLIYLSMPIILGSWIALIPLLFYPFIIKARIKNEEGMLTRELPGYK
jgi:protein-S-isoprenylcysteine O-methyltransferase Ste14